MEKNITVTTEEVAEIIRFYQEELDLSCDDVMRLCRKQAFLKEVANAISEHLEDIGVFEISFGKYDKEMDGIVDVVRNFLEY